MRAGNKMVGAKGFEPSTSWSRTKYLNPINGLSGVAYGTRSVISPLLVVRNLYVEFLQLQFQALRSQICERLPSKWTRIQSKSLLRLRLRVASGPCAAPKLLQENLSTPAAAANYERTKRWKHVGQGAG